jgi:hypothetical protein
MGQDEEIFLAKSLALLVSEVLRIYLLLQSEKRKKVQVQAVSSH